MPVKIPPAVVAVAETMKQELTLEAPPVQHGHVPCSSPDQGKMCLEPASRGRC